MTGLEPETGVVLEIATIFTDSQLNTLAEGPVFAISQSDEILDNMSDWCVEHHGKSGASSQICEYTGKNSTNRTPFSEIWVLENLPLRFHFGLGKRFKS